MYRQIKLDAKGDSSAKQVSPSRSKIGSKNRVLTSATDNLPEILPSVAPSWWVHSYRCGDSRSRRPFFSQGGAFLALVHSKAPEMNVWSCPPTLLARIFSKGTCCKTFAAYCEYQCVVGPVQASRASSTSS